MDIERRAFFGGGIALLAGSSAGAQEGPFRGAVRRALLPAEGTVSALAWQAAGLAGEPDRSQLDDEQPGPNRELWIRGVPFPEIHVYRPARPDGSSLLVLPGGGYEFLSVQNEGLDPAERFNAERTTVFMLTYRLPREGWDQRSIVALQDAQRGMRLIRSRAADSGSIRRGSALWASPPEAILQPTSPFRMPNGFTSRSTMPTAFRRARHS